MCIRDSPLSGGNQTYLDTSSNTCVTTCTQSYLVNSSLSQCNQCHSSCFRCSGFTALDCLECYEGDGDNLAYNSTSCTHGCSNGQYRGGSPLACLLCDAACQACSVNSSYCSYCGIVDGQQHYLVNNACIHPCATNYLDGPDGFFCDLCHAACLRCFTANSSSTCISCN